MDIQIHIISFGQVGAWIAHHKIALVAGWLAIIKILTAVQDAIDAMPAGLKPPFGQAIYLMKAIAGYLLAGNRVQAIAPPKPSDKAGNAKLEMLILVCVIMIFAGCASYNVHHIKGSATISYYGTPIPVSVDSWSCVGFTCPPLNEIANATSGGYNAAK